jgi:hypothetical protein
VGRYRKLTQKPDHSGGGRRIFHGMTTLEKVSNTSICHPYR